MRVAAAGVCHSDVHLADGLLGDPDGGRWCSATRAPAWSTSGRRGRDRRSRPATTSRSASCRRAAAAGRAGPAARRCARRRAQRRRGDVDGRHLAPARARRNRAPARPDGGLLCRVRGRAGSPARCRCRARSRCGRRRCLGCGVVTGIGAVNRARLRVGDERVRDRLRRRRPAGDRRGAAGRGGHDHRGRPRRRPSSSWRLRRGATHAVARDRHPTSSRRSGAHRRRASSTRSRSWAAPATIRQAWDVLRPGGTAIVVGAGPGRRRGVAARDRVPQSRRRSPAATTARPTSTPRSAELVAAGRRRAARSRGTWSVPDRARRSSRPRSSACVVARVRAR